MPRTLPVIDIGAATSEAGARAVGAKIDAACRDRGFFYVTGHGVDPALSHAVFDAARRFFALDQAEKDRVHLRNSKIRRGYEGIGFQTLDPGKPADLKESFYLGRDLPPDWVSRAASDTQRPVEGGTPNYGPNQWPDESRVPGFRAVTSKYFSEMDRLGRRVMGLMAVGLGLAPGYFERFLRDPMAVLRLLHYPPQPAVALPDEIGCGAHTDWGGITLLAQDDAGGLQVRDADDSWIDAVPVEGAYVVNLGDLMARWTNDRYRSTLHRVINAKSGRDRYSVPFFFDIDYHAEVTALPGCFDDDDPPHYPPITAGAHIVEMYRRTTGDHAPNHRAK